MFFEIRHKGTHYFRIMMQKCRKMIFILFLCSLIRNFADVEINVYKMQNVEIHSCPELMDFIQEVGFLPLLDSGIHGYSAEDVVDEDNRYVVFDDGG